MADGKVFYRGALLKKECRVHTYYLAIDLGASSGRLILGWLEDGIISIEEVHRFPNGPLKRDGQLVWDVDSLFGQIKTGLKRCAETGRIPASIGVDTWGVDFVLLDADDNRLGEAVSYRDNRTAGMDAEVLSIVDEVELYRRTGIERLIFNSIYQLYAVKKQQPELFARARTFLTMPDYLNFLLTGVKRNEYTEASTTQLIDAARRDWDWELLDTLGFPRDMFQEVARPGAALGGLRPALREELGFDARVMLPPCHDTEAAILALPDASGRVIYLNSGTWSLMGVERDAPDCREECLRAAFSNEGGYGDRICFHKNIMGLWIVQRIRGELEPKPGYEKTYAMAERGQCSAIIDVNAPEFLAPENMSEAIRAHCHRTKQEVPANAEALLACAYNSLAESYAATTREIERLTDRTYPVIQIMGGGCRDRLLNRLTGERTGKAINAGPVEATAIGNIMAQMLADGLFPSLDEARKTVGKSFGMIQ